MTDAVAALSSLAHESRLAVFRRLVEAGPAGDTPGQMASAMGISPSTLSFHLKELANAGLVTTRSESRFLIYSVDFARMAALMTFLTHNCCRGMPDDCVATLESALSRCGVPLPPSTTHRRPR